MSKASILKKLKDNLISAQILDLYILKCKDFIKNPNYAVEKVVNKLKTTKIFIVRSSSSNEDQNNNSNAGKFESILNVQKKDLKKAIQKVINSYGSQSAPEEEILIQPMLIDASMSGVMFTHCLKFASPYYVINYNITGDTASVTSGKGTCYTQFIYHESKNIVSIHFQKLIRLAKELIQKLDNQSLDIEFAFNNQDELFLLQTRPIVFKGKKTLPNEIKESLANIKNYFLSCSAIHPYLHGNRTILGIMPDWNPAEIIGIQPKPLALSLYKELITDRTWAYQRDNYGYRNLRSFPLLIDLCGLPYIDTRVSFNSFLPKDLPKKLGEKLANYYLDQLEKKPYLHDKIEFDIVFSCYTFDLKEKLSSLKKYFFSNHELNILHSSLRNLTRNIIHKKRGLWFKDAQKITELEKRYHKIFLSNNFDDLTKIYWLIEDCKRYGTLPFAGLARGAFIAVQLLQSLVNIGVLSYENQCSFLNSLNSISTNISKDFYVLSRERFLQKYGHLRPGTYDILSSRYDEDPDGYFNWTTNKNNNFFAKSSEFKLSLSQMHKIECLLKDHQLNHSVVDLFSFMKSAIENREHSKFIFTKSVSAILSLLKKYGTKHNISIEDLSFLDIKDLIKTYSSSHDILNEIQCSIQRNKKKYKITEKIVLPPLISSVDHIESFKLPETHPNFITKNKVTSRVISHAKKEADLKNAIVFIPNADPGYDWLFTRGIAGFITAYGGINSHMSIRAAELNIPAIIGAGKVLYEKWSNASKIHVDCENQQVKVLV